MCSTACECDPTPAKSGSSNSAKSCRRCGSEPFIIMDRVHVECKSCFLESCNRKIRSTIGKSKLMRNNDSILIAYSGGSSSTVLLDLIKNSIEGKSRREQKFRPSIIHVDVQSIINTTDPAERLGKLKERLATVSRQCPAWPLYWSTIEMSEIMPAVGSANDTAVYCVYEPGINADLCDSRSQSLLRNNEALDKLSASLRGHDLTGRQELVANRTNALINWIASDLNSSISKTTNSNDKFKFIFVGSSETQLANELLVSVILGNGSTIRSTVNICDHRLPVPVVRPMRDFSKKEIVFYAKARGLTSDTQPTLATFAHRKASIQTVTEAFLSKLYVDYPATYSTLLRTGNKMQE